MIYYPSKYSTYSGVKVEIVTGRSTSFQLVGLPPTDCKGDQGAVQARADHTGLLTYQADVYNLVERVKLVEVSEAGGWRLTWH